MVILIFMSMTSPAVCSRFYYFITSHFEVDSLVESFNSHCSAVLEKVAPSKLRRVPAVNPSPWLYDSVCCFRHKCRNAKRLWKSTKLHVHHFHYKDLILQFNTMAKNTRASCFFSLISKILLDTINNIVNLAPPTVPIFSNNNWSTFLSFYVGKVRDVRASIISTSTPFSDSQPHPTIMNSFTHITSLTWYIP